MAAKTTVIIVVKVGLTPRKIPKATPAKDTWDKVSLIKDCRRKTKKTPSTGANKAIAVIARKARTMKS
jgi:hypothetical protein